MAPAAPRLLSRTAASPRSRGVPRLPVRVRLLVIFADAQRDPGRGARRAGAQPRAGGAGGAADGADAIIANMLVSVVFLAVAAIVVSVDPRAGGVPQRGRAAGPAGGGDGRGRAGAFRRAVRRSSPTTRSARSTEGFNRMVRGLGEREFLRETFGKYVSAEIRDEILAGRIALQGQPREVTILFADIRDFTPWVEASDPREVVRDLNAYFTEMETAIRAHGGLVAAVHRRRDRGRVRRPGGPARHAEHAVRAALEMRRAAARPGTPPGDARAGRRCATASASTPARCWPATSAAPIGCPTRWSATPSTSPRGSRA